MAQPVARLKAQPKLKVGTGPAGARSGVGRLQKVEAVKRRGLHPLYPFLGTLPHLEPARGNPQPRK